MMDFTFSQKDNVDINGNAIISYKKRKEKQENIEGLLKLSLRCCRPSITGILASFATSGFFLPLFLLLPRRPASFSASPFGASPPPMRRQISSHTPGIFTVAASRLDSVATPVAVAIRR